MKFTDGGRVSWSKADRVRAKKEGKRLFVIGIVDTDGSEIVAMGGCDEADAVKITALVSGLLKRRED